ncbi:MAG TPA: hypothetical protein VLA64_15850, partial [Azonexus sp.]|nr:hypothetical protein [Azonexus sp.]
YQPLASNCDCWRLVGVSDDRVTHTCRPIQLVAINRNWLKRPAKNEATQSGRTSLDQENRVGEVVATRISVRGNPNLTVQAGGKSGPIIPQKHYAYVLFWK